VVLFFGFIETKHLVYRLLISVMLALSLFTDISVAAAAVLEACNVILLTDTDTCVYIRLAACTASRHDGTKHSCTPHRGFTRHVLSTMTYLHYVVVQFVGLTTSITFQSTAEPVSSV